MPAATESSAAAAFFYGADGIPLAATPHGDYDDGGVSGGRFPAARPVVFTQQFFPTTTVERCILAGAAVAAAGSTGRWARPASRAKSRRGPRSRSSQYRGVTFYRRTGRWESHWDCGKQVYLGGFDTAQAAARAYDQAAIKFRGVDADINFSLDDYKEDINKMSSCSKEEFVQVVRRQGAGFVRGSSRFRGVTLHKCGKAYDKAAMDHCGEEAVTNFEEEPKAASPAWDDLQSWGSEPDLELSLGCSGGSGGDPTVVISCGDDLHAAAPGSRRTSLTFEMPVDEEETAALCPGRNRSIWIRPSSRAITPPNPALKWCLDGDHQPSSISNMLQMGGMISGGGRAEAHLHMLGWPTGGSGNHWQPYAAASGFPQAPAGGHGAQQPGGREQQWR